MSSKRLPLILGLIAGGWVMAMKWFNIPNAQQMLNTTNGWNSFSSALGFMIGAIAIVRYHLTIIKRKKVNWGLSVYMLVLIVFLTLYGLTVGYKDKGYQWFVANMSTPAGSVIYALLGFYIASAAYRAFRMRTFEATVLLGAGIVVLLGRAPLTIALFPPISTLSTWLVDIINTSAIRGIVLGGYIGGFATAIRVLLGLERSHLGTGA